ncbi:MAG: DUF3459 domain-containing protein, partial [Allobranchiibius sp.]
ALPEQPEELSLRGEPALRAHQELIGLRRRHPWLHTARTSVVALTNATIIYDVTGEPGQRLRVAMNLGDEGLDVDVDGLGLQAGSTRDGGNVEPHGWAVFG